MKGLLLAVLLTSAAFGQSNKTDIAIHCVSLPGDVVGDQLCSALRLAVARSPRYEEAAANPQGWQLRLATMETKFRQPAALMASRHLFGPEPDREAQVHEVRDRWARLRRALGG